MDFLRIGDKLAQKKISPNKLYLDHKNPRFKGEKGYNISEGSNPVDRRVQDNIFDFLVKNRKYDISELKNSILRVGFLKMDRIVVRKINESAYVVLEGNRRVAAIKWILKDIDERSADVDGFILKSIKKIDVMELVGEDLSDEDLEKATWFLQGVRHISGIKRWGPYQQAELIKQFIDSGLTFTDAGQAVGVGPRKAGQMMRAYAALTQMQQDDEFSDYGTPDLFSHFEQAIIKHPIKQWIGWDEEKMSFTNMNGLQRFYELITPDANGEVEATAVEVREKLPKILESGVATEYLMNGNGIDFCYAIALSEKASAPTWHSAVKDAIRKLVLSS